MAGFFVTFMITQTAPVISIKGIREGLLITVDEGPYDEVFHLLSAEIEKKRDFLRGSRIALAVGKRPKTGKPQQLLDYEGISGTAIVKQIKELM